MSNKRYRQIVKAKNGEVLVGKAKWCDTFLTKLGFTLRRKLSPGEGLVLVEDSDSRLGSGITMLFCFLHLGVIWVNGDGEVVDTVIARPWRPSYLPKAPARYAIEAAPGIVQRVNPGDKITFMELPPDKESDGDNNL